MKVFISSVISGMEKFRDAVDEAIGTLKHEVVRAEGFGASPASPRIACLEGVRSSDATVLILGQRYGDKQSKGLSATHEEYKEAREAQQTVVVMIQKDVSREPLQQKFIQEVRDWETGHYTGSFGTREELFRETIRVLHQLDLQKATGPVNSDEILQRALDQLPQPGQLHFVRRIPHGGPQHEKGYYLQKYSPQGPLLALTLACGPFQNVLRPAQLESLALSDRLLEIALHGPAAVFTTEEGTDAEVAGDALLLQQQSRAIHLYEDGSLSFAAILPRPTFGLSGIIEEDVSEEIDRFISFADEVLSYIDGNY